MREIDMMVFTYFSNSESSMGEPELIHSHVDTDTKQRE